MAGLVAVVGFGVQCSQQYALLLTIRATSLVESFDLRVKDLATGAVVLERIGEPVDPDHPNRDISAPGEALKVAIEFANGGNYLVYILGRAGQGSSSLQFALKDYQVDDVREASITLVPLVDDQDQDGYPGCGSQGVNCKTVACAFLDCNDSNELVHPFAQEVCGNGEDDDCSAGCNAVAGKGDLECVDADGDGVPAPIDCDDNDPCRSPELTEAQNLCQTAAGAFPALSQACLDKLAGGAIPSPPYCGDGIDQDCNGQDVACKTDEDCDGVSPPADCDDKNKAINPGAQEECDGVDNNCNQVIDEGCVACDVDGDGHADPAVTDPNCKDKQDKLLPRDDPDDMDAGVFPGSTQDSGGDEGGTVTMALRHNCGYSTTKSGVRARDVDHDGDGSAAKDDGCPTEACDADGDGFPGAQCSPPKSQEDCDDDNAQVFPGAPDVCGDGIKQNCVADVPCAQITDKDGDRYADSVDCDDDNADVRFWQVEKCDGIDNDCDGLVDEGNPGPDGTPIPTGPNNKLCNNNNEGECAGGGPSSTQACPPGSTNCSAAGRVLSGQCACSKVEPNAERDEGNRVQCPGETLDAPSPRCFGATTPKVEECDDKDWDCNGAVDDPTGANPLTDQGKTCSTSVGNCVAGTVTGCDMSQNLPEAALIEKVLGDQGIEFDRHWVCSGQQYPTAERCNGKDDDCNGQLPSDELDTDGATGDKYLPCSGCTIGSGRLDLLGTLQGCGDCNNSVPTIYPGAPEQCNDVDDDCNDGKTDDGETQCTGALPDCCSSQKTCRNLGSDMVNCGTCGNVCNTKTADRCSGGSCVCGNTGSACGPGLDCVGGTCQCIQNGRCNGCCAGNTCQGGDAIGGCGNNGEACKNCDDGNECTANVCSASTGNCSNPDEPSTKSCASGSGKCRNGNCCSGNQCWTGSSCVAGVSSIATCGTQGISCQTCTAPECRSPSCTGGSCGSSSANEGGGCASGSGTCRSGSCCSGTRCWTGSSCVQGATNTTTCGIGGNTCQGCSAPECQAPTCSGGSCGTASANEGSSCASGSGRCRSGGCCSGNNCWNGSSCVAGATNTAACGVGGNGCQICNAPECQSATCGAGFCGTENANEGGNCSSGGTCRGGGCCSGSKCWNGSSCVTGTGTGACGKDGDFCSNCSSAGECQVDTCSGGSCGVAPASDGSSCSGGTCYGGSCCSGNKCWTGSACVPGNSDKNNCGTGGVSCVNCPEPECKVASCSSGSCSTSNASDGTSCSGGTCAGGSCCNGSNQCRSGSSCVDGTTDGQCGSNGSTCVSCGGGTPTCNNGVCE